MAADPTAAEIAATVRIALTWVPPKHQAKPKAALDALVARCEASEKREELALNGARAQSERAEATEARVAALETALRDFLIAVDAYFADTDDHGPLYAAEAAARAALEGGTDA